MPVFVRSRGFVAMTPRWNSLVDLFTFTFRPRIRKRQAYLFDFLAHCLRGRCEQMLVQLIVMTVPHLQWVSIGVSFHTVRVDQECIRYTLQ